MCLLYLGPHPAPGIEDDYRLSPVLAPPALLAALPPLLLQCGARDPLVDDTACAGAAEVKAEVKTDARKGSGEEGKASGGYGGDAIHELEDEDEVTMQIFPGWSHGYLQMSALMRGARVAIDDIADWIDAAFVRAQMQTQTLSPSPSPSRAQVQNRIWT
ncbi:hypothetical protein EW145_g6260 [Phellinidium pouzarii]|uniref:Alpha/beta hydrolase fold-3 domain-containing protein n=1 Tax=Phellinidium pouzarii TaxID=167371 RepID=A0A4V3XBV3_9AGAM|nr:hypothetical protein EW145_g6260 [Phellinidium pouzarii]